MDFGYSVTSSSGSKIGFEIVTKFAKNHSLEECFVLKKYLMILILLASLKVYKNKVFFYPCTPRQNYPSEYLFACQAKQLPKLPHLDTLTKVLMCTLPTF